jgi:Ca2+:H+ antiporter
MINVLLFAVPVRILLNYVHPAKGGWTEFCINLVAIIPLAAMLSKATEELAHWVGDGWGALSNVTFGYVQFRGLAQGGPG